MPHYVTYAVRDYSNEESRFTINFGAVTAVSIAGLLAQLGDLKTAVGNLILGVLGKEQLVMDSTVLDNSAASTPNAQVELKLQFNYEGTTNHKKFRFEIPTADPSKVLAGTDVVDMTDSEVAAVITAFEAVGRSPDSDQETVQVTDVRLVGRNI